MHGDPVKVIHTIVKHFPESAMIRPQQLNFVFRIHYSPAQRLLKYCYCSALPHEFTGVTTMLVAETASFDFNMKSFPTTADKAAAA